MVSLDRPTVGADGGQPTIRPYALADVAWALELLEATGGRHRVRRGNPVDVAGLPGLVAERLGHPSALVTLRRPSAEEVELSVIACAPFDDGLVAGLLHATDVIVGDGCRRVYAICSNAEFDVQRVLQRVGFRLCASRPGSIEAVAARADVAIHTHLGGLPMRDELEFERLRSLR